MDGWLWSHHHEMKTACRSAPYKVPVHTNTVKNTRTFSQTSEQGEHSGYTASASEALCEGYKGYPCHINVGVLT
jgi:hypothetical protein